METETESRTTGKSPNTDVLPIPAGHRFRRVCLATLTALLGISLAVAYVVDLRAPAYGLYHDDGIYLVTAKALATGHGYRILSLPDQLWQTKYPPLFPFLLAIVWKIWPNFPHSLPALRLVPLLATIGWALASFLYLRDRLESRAALWLVTLTMATPFVVFFTVSILSETMFACLLTASLLVLTRVCESETESIRSVLVAAAFAAGAILTRTAGLVPLVIAGTVGLALNKKTRSAIVFFAGTVIPVLPWIVWSRAHNPAPGSIEAYYSGLNYASWNLFGNFSWSQRYAIVLKNAFNRCSRRALFWGFRRDTGRSLSI